MRKSLVALPIAAACLCATAATALAAPVLKVDDDGVQCPGAYTTIQAAVNAAPSSGAQIQVCDGVYREQVHVLNKNNIDLVSKSTRGATVTPPASFANPGSDPKAIFWLDGGSADKVRRFRIVGPGPGLYRTLDYGVLVENNTSGKYDEVRDNLIQDIRDSQAAANPNGRGVGVGRYDYETATAYSSGRALVLRNEIVRYQKAGVDVEGPSSFAQVGSNTIRGLGRVTSNCGGQAPPAQQGVQIGDNGAADVLGNRISENQYSGDPCGGASQYASFGILVLDSIGRNDPQSPRTLSRLKTNNVFNNDIGIGMDTNGGTGGASGVHNWLVETNRVHDNESSGGAALTGGILVDNSSGNVFNRNDARSNDGGLDCSDSTSGGGSAGTANTWTHNRGLTAAPAAICTPAGNP